MKRIIGALLSVTSHLDLQEALGEIVGTACRLTGARYAAIGVLASSGQIDPFVSHGVEPELIAALDGLTAAAPVPDASARVRLWVDRAFTIRGAGTVVTGTLTAGSLRTGETVQLHGETISQSAGVRGLQSRSSSVESVAPTARVAVNLRDVPAADLHRGDVLLTPGAWPIVEAVDVRRTMGRDLDDGAVELMAHIGTAAVPARLRAFDSAHARLTFDRPLPLQVTDRIVLRGTGSRSVHAGVAVLDIDPPALRRRGAGARRGQELASRPPEGDVLAEAARRGAVAREVLVRFGLSLPETGLPAEVEEPAEGWLVHRPAFDRWAATAKSLVAERLAAQPMTAGVTVKAVSEALRRAAPPLPADDPGSAGIRGLILAIIGRAGLETSDGMVRPPGHVASLGPAEAGIAEVERRA